MSKFLLLPACLPTMPSTFLAYSLDGGTQCVAILWQCAPDWTNFSAEDHEQEKSWNVNQRWGEFAGRGQKAQISLAGGAIEGFCPDIVANQPFYLRHAFVWTPFRLAYPSNRHLLQTNSTLTTNFEVLEAFLLVLTLVGQLVGTCYITCCAQAKAGFHMLQCMFNWEGAKYSELQMPKSESFLWVCINLCEAAMLHYAFGGVQIIYILISLLNTRYRSLGIFLTTIFGSFEKEQIWCHLCHRELKRTITILSQKQEQICFTKNAQFSENCVEIQFLAERILLVAETCSETTKRQFVQYVWYAAMKYKICLILVTHGIKLGIFFRIRLSCIYPLALGLSQVNEECIHFFRYFSEFDLFCSTKYKNFKSDFFLI